MSRALITGGAGFIGCHLSEALLERGWTVGVADDLSTGSIENISHLKGHPHFAFVLDIVMNRPLILGQVVEFRPSNPDILEWGLKKRVRRRNVERPGKGIVPGTEVVWSPSSTARGSVRSLCASRMLPWIRRHFPGGKLQLLATRGS